MHINDFLWSNVSSELGGAHYAVLFSNSELFTEQERKIFRKIAVDEIRHADISMQLARTRTECPANWYLVPKKDHNDLLMTLRRMSRGEALFLRIYPQQIRPLLTNEEAKLMDTVVQDEKFHRAFSRHVLHRLRDQVPSRKEPLLIKDTAWRDKIWSNEKPTQSSQ